MLLHRFAEAVDMELCKWMAQIRTLLCLEISGKEHEKWVVVFLLVALQGFQSPPRISALASPQHL